MTGPYPIAIVGPTAVGKSAVGEFVARHVCGEIINADSMQVYRRMDVGTAKVPLDERGVRYHCIDIVDPGDAYSAALYQRDARGAIDGLLGRGVIPVIVGGTGLYVRATLDEFEFPAGELTGESRSRLETRARALGPEALHRELARVDPASAARIHPANVRRTIRALEMHAEGRSYAEQAEGFRQRRFHYPLTRIVGLTMERSTLYARIDARVDAMLAHGLLDEVRHLVADGYAEALTAAQAIGYKELVSVLRGGTPLDDAITAIKQASRRYAKRQLSWFRADERVEWIDVTGLSPSSGGAAVLDLLESPKREA